MDVLPMGSPLSPLSAEIFMDEMERRIFENSLYKDNIIKWCRYCDDIFCIWQGEGDTLTSFLEFINNLHHNIKFTLEIGGKQINFLDLQISIDNGRLEFDIFRKPTSSDVYIPADSCHPWSQKLSAFQWMVDRLLRVPLTQEKFEEEKSTIELIARRNGYSPEVVRKIIRRKNKEILHRKIYKGETKDLERDGSWCGLTFMGDHSEKLARVIRKEGIQVAYKPFKNLGRMICNPKDGVSMENRSGVYSIECGSCPATYVGKTGRRLQDRVKEHLPTSSKASIFKDHLHQEGHVFDKKKVNLLRFLSNGPRLDIEEKIEIKKCKKQKGEDCLNVQTFEEYTSPIIELVAEKERERGRGGPREIRR